MSRRLITALAMIFALLLAAVPMDSNAATAIEKLMMPGPLSQSHVKQEDDCANCHKVLLKAAQSDLCIDCHKPIKADVANKKGFHGLNAAVTKSDCYFCHSEHKGRAFQLIQFEPAAFNHAETNFPLQGLHADVACASCHKPGKKFREATSTCNSCHGEQQPHLGNLGTKCETCHNTSGWKKVAAFDHNKTNFALKGAHSKAQCISCHVGEIYKGLSSACIDCHAIQDVHGGKFGTKCADCHSVEKWKEAKFDHAKSTRFALLGAHEKAKCADCHGADVSAKISMECVSCHKEQDVHKATLGINCGTCHGVVAWKQNVKFDHGLTNYPLVGQHAFVPCESCHETRVYKGAATTCVSCHASDDTHEGRFSKACATCHSPLGWKRVSFDHARDAHWALTGAHNKVGCYSCHTSKNVVSAKLATDCYSCHKAQDVHRGAYGTNCAKCHSTATFRSATIRQ